MGAKRPSPKLGAVAWTRVQVYACMRGRVDTLTAPLFLKDKSSNLLKIVSVLLSAPVERVGVSRMLDFFFYLKAELKLKSTNTIKMVKNQKNLEKSLKKIFNWHFFL